MTLNKFQVISSNSYSKLANIGEWSHLHIDIFILIITYILVSMRPSKKKMKSTLLICDCNIGDFKWTFVARGKLSNGLICICNVHFHKKILGFMLANLTGFQNPLQIWAFGLNSGNEGGKLGGISAC